MNRYSSFLRSIAFFFIPLSIFIVSCSTTKVLKPFTDYKIQKTVMADKAVVSAAHPLATKVGLDILKQGGNAIDAAIAVQLALAVVYPRAGNIGGGGFLVYRSGDGKETSHSNHLPSPERPKPMDHVDFYLL